MLYYTKSTRQTLKELAITENGLAKSDASERLRLYGPNTIKIRGDPLWRKLAEPFANVFVLVLFIAAAISLYHQAFLDALIISVIILASAAIYYFQRFSTERILRALQKNKIQYVETLRDGKTSVISSDSLVPGDIILLIEGERVPADARLLTTESLRIDESQLTGESTPVSKQTDAVSGDKEVYEQSNMIFQGSFVVSGQARAVIVATGNNTQFGQMAALASHAIPRSPVQVKIDKLIAQIIAVVAAIAAVAFILAVGRGMNLTDSLQFVIALSVSAVPESLPVAISIILALGMRRMAAKKALVRTMNSIETIGVITTIATDKTGTLTKNQLTVQDVWHPHDVSKQQLLHSLTYATIHASQKIHDPLDTAFDTFSKDQKAVPPKQAPMASLPFDQAVAMSGNVWHDGSSYILAVKGAPEHVLARCDLTESEHEKASAELHALTSNGYRVLAVAHRDKLTKPIRRFSDLPQRIKLVFDGFVAVADVLRPEAKRAIEAAQQAGVTVRMITGDHFETAYHIGKQLGMVTHRGEVFDSRHMSVMSDEELEKVIDTIRVFSRVTPEHKYRILTLLKKHNITAMTGDGVNDVPALASAHVGIAMGSGAHIAQDAGDIILVDNNFKSIVDAMREGRIIFANVRRMLYYLLSTNAGEVATALGSLIIGLPIPLVPVQILWVNLVTDTSMVIPLGLEPGEKSTMKRRPNKPDAPILGKLLISRMVLVALAMAALTIALYIYYSSLYDYNYGRTIAFSALVVMQWANAFNARSDDESLFVRLRTFNRAFYVGLAIAIGLQAFAVFGPLSELLHITPVATSDLIITGITSFVVLILLVELHKYIGRRYFKRGAHA